MESYRKKNTSLKGVSVLEDMVTELCIPKFINEEEENKGSKVEIKMSNTDITS
jgi:hypothetical protein